MLAVSGLLVLFVPVLGLFLGPFHILTALSVVM